MVRARGHRNSQGKYEIYVEWKILKGEQVTNRSKHDVSIALKSFRCELQCMAVLSDSREHNVSVGL